MLARDLLAKQQNIYAARNYVKLDSAWGAFKDGKRLEHPGNCAPKIYRAEAIFLILKLLGASITPRSVMMAVIAEAGVTSKAGL